MYRLSRVGQDMMGAAFVLLACLGFGQPAFATGSSPTADDQSLTTAEDTPLPVVLSGSDPESDALTFNVGTPSNGTLSGTAPNLTYTPTADFNGPDSFTFTVNDGTSDSPDGKIVIDVTASNDAPIADTLSVSTSEDAALPLTLTGNDIDGDGLSFTVVSGPSNGLLSGTAPNLTYTPAADFNGTDSFTFTANDGTVDSAVATVSITISAGNDVPVAVAQSLTTAEDAPLAITLAATDTDGDALTYSASTPGNGTLTGTAPNLTYTPASDFNGSDGFSFTVDDGTSTGSALVSINVSAVNDAPIVAAVPAPIAAIEDSGTVTANIAGMFDDVDLSREGDSLTLSVVWGIERIDVHAATDRLAAPR